MTQDVVDAAFQVCLRMAADRSIVVDRADLMNAVIAVTGVRDGQDEPVEIAEDALDLLGKGLRPSTSQRGRRPF